MSTPRDPRWEWDDYADFTGTPPGMRHFGTDGGAHHAVQLPPPVWPADNPGRDPRELLREIGDTGMMMDTLGDLAADPVQMQQVRSMARDRERQRLHADDLASQSGTRSEARMREAARQEGLTRALLDELGIGGVGHEPGTWS
jgi:hypothetical protein